MPTKKAKTKRTNNKNCKCQNGGEFINHTWWKHSPSDIAYMLNKSLKKNRYISKVLLSFPDNYYARNIGKIFQHYGYGVNINKDRRHQENLKIPLIL